MTVSERLCFLLKNSKKLSQKELAASIGVPTSTVNNWVKLGRDLPTDKLLPVCQYCGCSITYLLTGTDSSNIDEEDAEWLDIVHHIPEDKREMCKDFLKTHVVVPEKYSDRKKG